MLLGSLKRHRWTRAQAALGKEKRKGNVKGAFKVKDAKSVSGRRLLLVDDVCTTGATLDACAAALKAAGAKTVDALTLARDVKSNLYVQRARGLAFQVHGFPAPAVNLPGRPDR